MNKWMHNKWMVRIDGRIVGYNNEWINRWRMNELKVENVTDRNMVIYRGHTCTFY